MIAVLFRSNVRVKRAYQTVSYTKYWGNTEKAKEKQIIWQYTQQQEIVKTVSNC